MCVCAGCKHHHPVAFYRSNKDKCDSPGLLRPHPAPILRTAVIKKNIVVVKFMSLYM